jgi:hypothetical protein
MVSLLLNRQNTELMWTSKAKKLSAFTMSPGYQDELTGPLSIQYAEITTEETDGFLAVSVCCNLAFLGSGGYWSSCH